MKLSIAPEVLADFRELAIGVVSAAGVRNQSSHEVISGLLRQEVQRIQREHTRESLARMPEFLAWRGAYARFNGNPKKYRCSAENLYATVLERGDVRSIHMLVDLYNVISLRHAVPVGGEDTSRVEGDIVLCRASGHEPFVALNGEETTYPKPGEVVYRDALGVLCRRWNWREAERTKLTLDTRSLVLVVEGLPPVGMERVGAATAELAELVQDFAGGSVEMALLNAEKPEVTLLAETS